MVFEGGKGGGFSACGFFATAIAIIEMWSCKISRIGKEKSLVKLRKLSNQS